MTDSTRPAFGAEGGVVEGIELPAVPDVQILRLRPGDTLVVNVKERLSDAEFDELGSRLKESFPDHPIAVLEGGSTLSVLRKEG